MKTKRCVYQFVLKSYVGEPSEAELKVMAEYERYKEDGLA